MLYYIFSQGVDKNVKPVLSWIKWEGSKNMRGKYFKEITSIEKFDDTKILIDTANKLPDDITFIKIVILLTCVIKEDGKLYPQIFLEKTLVL